jgi:hypothetical protein
MTPHGLGICWFHQHGTSFFRIEWRGKADDLIFTNRVVSIQSRELKNEIYEMI